MDLSKENIEQIKALTIYISRTKSLKNLKEKVADLLTKCNYFALDAPQNFVESQVRLWKLGMNVSVTDINDFLNSKLDEIKSDSKCEVLYDIPDIAYLERIYYY